ncbi:hypothetical protein AGMMS49944_13120 [Spirochaetia bacterium]|nr:hypothetical protein AGMMS49944_13120 [Spirochaetia bacterium]
MKVRIVGIIAIGAVIMAGLSGCNTLQSIEVSTAPVQTVYGQGQRLDTSGLVVMGHFKKDSRDITNDPKNRPSISGYDTATPGVQTVTVTVKKQSAAFKVTVVPVEKLSITAPPATTVIMQGDDFSPAGLSARAEFENDAVPAETIEAGRLKFSGYDKDKPGNQTITAVYFGKKADFTVRVAGLSAISVVSPPNKIEYFTGEELELAGLAVQGTWEEGMGERQITITKENLSGYDITQGRAQTVTVTYSGKRASFPVTYIALQALTVNRRPDKLDYQLGEELELSGIQIQGTWPGNSLALIDRSRPKYSGYDKFAAGKQRITVTLGGRNDTFEVTVANPFEGTWSGQWLAGKQAHTDGPPTEIWAPVTLTMEGTGWLLRTNDSEGKSVELRGTYTPDSVTHAKLQCNDSKGAGDVNRDSSTVMRLKNGLIRNEITLNKK